MVWLVKSLAKHARIYFDRVTWRIVRPSSAANLATVSSRLWNEKQSKIVFCFLLAFPLCWFWFCACTWRYFWSWTAVVWTRRIFEDFMRCLKMMKMWLSHWTMCCSFQLCSVPYRHLDDFTDKSTKILILLLRREGKFEGISGGIFRFSLFK